MSVIMSLFLGLVQGITEFLPISSTGHQSILQNLFSIDYVGDDHQLFRMFLYLGSMLSIIGSYRKEIVAMFNEGISFLRMRSEADLDEIVVMKPPARALLFVLIGTLPMFLTLIFLGSVRRLFPSVGFIGFAMGITGGLLFVSDRYITKGKKTDKTMTLGDAIIIGLSQAVAVIPGLSRCGMTISVGLSRGLSGSFSVRFSMLLSLPVLFASMVAALFAAIRNGINFALFPVYLVGFVITTVAGYFAIQLIRRLIGQGGFGKFAYYCWGVGALTLILSLIL